MATSKTLTPTNVTIQIPEFTDQPDQRVNSNCIDKEADAINSLNTAIGNLTNAQSVNDTNTAISTGLYKTNSSASNTPYSGYWAILVNAYGQSDTSQIAVNINTSDIYVRTYHDGTTWTSWNQFAIGGEETLNSIGFTNFTATTSDIKCYKYGNVYTIAVKFTVDTSTSSNARINAETLPNGGKTFKVAHGQWYDNTNDESGYVTGYYGAGIRLARAGSNTNFSSRVNHNISLIMTYIVA